MKSIKFVRVGRSALMIVCATFSHVVHAQSADRGTELLAQFAAANDRAARGNFVDVIAPLFAPEGVYVTPFPGLNRGPAGARAWLTRDTMNVKSTAHWTVIHHDVAADGRNAFTYGYLDVIHPAGDSLLGKFQAYWRRSEGGQWQILAFSRGGRAPGTPSREFPAPLVRGMTKRSGRVDTIAVLRDVFATEGAFADSAGRNLAAAFAGFAAPDVGKLQGTATFSFGPAAVALIFANPPAGSLGPMWTPEWGSVASSGDLAFTLGPAWARVAGPTQTPPASGGRYFTIWKLQPNGTWRYVVD